MKRKGQKTAHPQKGSLRVQSWIYAVLNPLFDGIEREGGFLETRNLTWRFYKKTFEFLLPAVGYVGPGANHALEDFLKANPKERRVIGRHDTLLEGLREHAHRAYEAICTDSDFLRLVQDRLSQFEAREPTREYPGGAIPRDQFPRLVAERVLNNISQPPAHHKDAEFWRESRDAFARFRDGEAFQKLNVALDALRRYDGTLMEHLGEIRYQFCQKYDLPADPLPYMSYVAERSSPF